MGEGNEKAGHREAGRGVAGGRCARAERERPHNGGTDAKYLFLGGSQARKSALPSPQ